MDEYFEKVGRAEAGYTEIKHCGEKNKILLIGDSVCMGYRVFVQGDLNDEYDVVYPEENCRNSQYIITTLKAWVNMFENTDDVELVSFNCGHWDVAHWNGDNESLTSIVEYEKNIKKIIRYLRKFFPKANIVFFTTSPMCPNRTCDNYRSNSEIEKYNDIAVSVSKSENIYTADIYGFIKLWDESKYIDHVHLTAESNKVLGKYVTNVILDILKK